MAELYGSHFEYAGILSRKYGLIFCTAGTSRYTQISGKIEGVTIYHRAAKATHLVGNDYSNSPVSFSVDIVTDDDSVISKEDRKEIERWLFNRGSYHKLYIDIADDRYGETYELVNGEQKRLYLNCRFLNARRLEYNGGTVGYNATLEADSGYWWQDPVSTEIVMPTDSNEVKAVVRVDSDIDDYIYPAVKVVMNSDGIGGKVEICNITDDKTRVSEIIELPAGSTVEMNGEMNYICGGVGDVSFNNMEVYNKLDEMMRLMERVNVILDGNVNYASTMVLFEDCVKNGAIGMTGYAEAETQPASQEDIEAGVFYTISEDTVTVYSVTTKIFKYVRTTTYTEGTTYYVNVSDGSTHTVFITRYSDPCDITSTEKDDSEVIAYINGLSENGTTQGVISSDYRSGGILIHTEDGRPDTIYWYDFLTNLYGMIAAVFDTMVAVSKMTSIGMSKYGDLYETIKMLMERSNTRIFPRLLDGENEIVIKSSSVAGVKSITFEFQNRRML